MRWSLRFLLAFWIAVGLPVWAETDSTSTPSSASTDDKNDTAQAAQRTLWSAYILRRKTGEAVIEGLRVPARKIPVVLVSKEGRLRPVIEIKGIYDRKGWKLFVQNYPLRTSDDVNDFKTFAYLNAKINQVALTAKGPNGEVENETIYVYAPDAQEFEVVSNWDRVILTAGPSILSYSQTGYGNLTALTAAVSAQYATPPDRASRWGLFASADFTSLLFMANRPIDSSPDMLQIKGDALYRLTSEKPHFWHIQALAGISYLTMFANGSPFGFSNLIVPEVGFRSRYLLSSKTALVGEVRALPIRGLFSQRGYDLYLGWSHILTNFHRFEMGISVSDYYYASDSNTNIQYDLVTLKLGYTL